MSLTAQSSDHLLAVIGGNVVGVVEQAPRTAQLAFRYDAAWRELEGAFPLSLSMPLQQQVWADERVRTVLGGWIPDRAEVLNRIAAEYKVSTDNPFAVLGAIGEDCPGAVQFIRPERFDQLIAAGPGQVTWITEADLASRLRTIRLPGGIDRLREDRGRFSLPGQQPKIALVYEVDHTGCARWGIPDAAHPTTHILKPPSGGDVRYVAAEYIALRIADEAGLGAADSFVIQAEDETALAVVRYDRLRLSDETWYRVHQEDLCQALGWSPKLKFEEHNGPGAKDIVECLRTYSSDAVEDVDRFVRALALNWILLGTDAHARNYSLLLNSGQVRLAPLYDVMTALEIAPPQVARTLKLAMQIGGCYRANQIGRTQWRGLAVDIGLAPSDVEGLVKDFAAKVADAAEQSAAAARADGLLPPEVVDTLERRIVRRAQRCARLFDGPAR